MNGERLVLVTAHVVQVSTSPPNKQRQGVHTFEEYLAKVATLMNLPVWRERAVVWLDAAVKHLLKPEPQDASNRKIFFMLTWHVSRCTA